MAMTSAQAQGQPMMEMNTTPLIDVMLVLLIMLIMTIPLASHSLEVDLPGDKTAAIEIGSSNRLVLTVDDAILWNGRAVTRPQLIGLLQQSTRLPVEPELQFEPAADAGYDATAKVIATIKRSGVTKFGFVGNERFGGLGEAANAPAAK
jgi:biopolymer transport protein ExbD